MTRKEFIKRLQHINPKLHIINDHQLKPIEILFVDYNSNVAATVATNVFDLTDGTWGEGYNYLSSTELDELKNLLRDSYAFLKGTHLFEESASKDLTPDNSLKEYIDHLAKTLKENNTAYGDIFTELVNQFGLEVIPIRLSDKFNRVCELTKRGESKENDESLEDALLDLAVYSILGLKYIKEHKDKHDKNTHLNKAKKEKVRHKLDQEINGKVKHIADTITDGFRCFTLGIHKYDKDKDGSLGFYGKKDDPKDLSQGNATLPPLHLPDEKLQLKERVKYLEDRNETLEKENTKLEGELSAYRQMLKTFLDILSKEHEHASHSL